MRRDLATSVQSVAVAAKVLEFLAESGRPQRVTDIALRLGMTKARVSRHLSTLLTLGFVAKMPDNSGYRLGSTLFSLANAAAEQYEITNIAYRFMRSLRSRIAEALILAIPAGGDALCVSTMDSGRPLTPKLSRGARLSIPLSPTAWVVLAFSPERIRERVLARRTDRNPTRADALHPDKVRSRCARIRERLYEFHLDPHDAGFSVLSAPIFNHSERLEAALASVMNRRQSANPQEVRYLGELMETTAGISETLGSTEMAGRLALTS